MPHSVEKRLRWRDQFHRACCHWEPVLTKLREWIDDDGHERDEYGDYCWPAPPEYTEYRVEGQMRADILARVGRQPDDTCEVRLIEGCVEGGFSEYTVEHDYPIEVWIHEGRQAQKVYDDGIAPTSESAFSWLLRWIGEGQR